MMRNQQLARTALQKARARQRTTDHKRQKEGPLITPGKTEVTLRSEPYVHQIGRNHKLGGPWLEPFSVSEGPNRYDNHKLNLPPIRHSIHRWIHCSHLRIHLRPDLKAFPGLPELSSRGPVTIDASGQEESEVEKVRTDRIYRKKCEFLIALKGKEKIEATWDPLDVLERLSTAFSNYWFDTDNETIPFHLRWPHNQCWSAWAVRTPGYIPLWPELDPTGFWTPIQDSGNSETQTCYTFLSLY